MVNSPAASGLPGFIRFLLVLIGSFPTALGNYRRLSEIVIDIAAETHQISRVAGYQADAYRLWFAVTGVARSGGSV